MNRAQEAVKWLEIAADDGLPCYPLFEHDASLNNIRRQAGLLTFMATRRTQWEAWRKMFE